MHQDLQWKQNRDVHHIHVIARSCLWVHMYVQVCVYLCTWLWSLEVDAGCLPLPPYRLMGCGAGSYSIPSSVDQYLASQLAPEISSFTLEQCGCRQPALPTWFYVGAKNLTQVLMFAQQALFFYWAISPACHIHFTGCFILEFTWHCWVPNVPVKIP